MHVEEACVIWHFSIILISLKVEVAQISDFLVHAKILPLWTACFWDFRDALRRKSLCFFSGIFYKIRKQKLKTL